MSINIAVVGATGNVGREMLAILASKKFDSKNSKPNLVVRIFEKKLP